MTEFWKRWSREYLPLLMYKHNKITKTKQIKKGDVVLLKNDLTDRRDWPLALVYEVYPSAEDGIIRTVQVKVNNKYYKRPIQRIYNLEIHEQ